MNSDTDGLSLSGLRSALAGPFDLELKSGTCAAITGPSGSGKSLFLRMIADLDPNEGEVRLRGVTRSNTAPAEWRRRAVYLAAESGWWADNVNAHFRNDQTPSVKKLFERLGLKQELFDGPVSRLSTGERQRAALVRGLVLSPELLLLDEPTSALDETSIHSVEEVLQEVMLCGTSIVLVTHDRRQAERLATAHYRMTSGRLEAA